MSTALNRMPTYKEPVVTKGVTTRGWYTFWSGLFSGQPTGPIAALTVGPSPFTYIAPVGGTVYLAGGTTTQVKLSRDGLTTYVTGAIAGPFPLSQGDQLTVVYSVGPPTAIFVPR